MDADKLNADLDAAEKEELKVEIARLHKDFRRISEILADVLDIDHYGYLDAFDRGNEYKYRIALKQIRNIVG